MVDSCSDIPMSFGTICKAPKQMLQKEPTTCKSLSVHIAKSTKCQWEVLEFRYKKVSSRCRRLSWQPLQRRRNQQNNQEARNCAVREFANKSAASAASPDYVKFQAVIKSAASAASFHGGRASGRLDHGFFFAIFGRASGQKNSKKSSKSRTLFFSDSERELRNITKRNHL